jgi:hypothetical protein
MFGEPSDAPGECNARLFIADNYGDGTATMRCQLALGHEGLHQEKFDREGPVTITWTADERRRCDHGCGQWEHDHRSEIQCPKDADNHEYSDCAHCHQGEKPQICAACGAPYYYEEGHRRICAKEPFACPVCGENGIGPHSWPMGCPNAREAILARGVADELDLDP